MLCKEYMRRSDFYRAYTKELIIIIIIILIILIQVDRQSESAILWIILHSGQEPVPAEKRARRGREPQTLVGGEGQVK